MVLVSVLGTGLVTGTGAYLVLGRNKLTKKGHDSICELRMKLVEQRIDFLREGQARVEATVKAILGILVAHNPDGEGS